MFMSEYSHSIDAKGRVIVPAKFREELGESFVVTQGLDGCLFVFPNEEWKNFEEKLKTLPMANKDARKFVRFFLAGAALAEVDKQGRILLPAVLVSDSIHTVFVSSTAPNTTTAACSKAKARIAPVPNRNWAQRTP